MKLGAVAAAAALLLTGCGASGAPRAAPLPPGAAVVTVSPNSAGRAIPAGFLGLSLEFPAVTAYAGHDPRALNPVFEQLIRNLAPGQAPVLRIGGDSTDWTWVAVRGLRRPAGVRISLSKNWLQVTGALASALRARLILGVDLEAGSRPVAAAQARAFAQALPPRSIMAFEPGNEPELYPSFGWYRDLAGREVPGRAPGYDFAAYNREFQSFAQVLPGRLAGPATGSVKWMSEVGPFVAAQPRLGVVTLHRYPLQQCFVPTDSPLYPDVANLLADAASSGLAQSVAPYAALAHGRQLPLRIDEMNTISCGSSPLGRSFATALWAPDALFAMASAGVDGVNIHTYPSAPYGLFSFRHTSRGWTGRVEPEYYGLLLFAQAAPPGSRLLSPTLSGPVTPGLRVWATHAPDGHVRVLLVNDSPSRARTVALKAPGGAAAQIERLSAPSLSAAKGVTLGGQSFGPQTTTGTLAGAGAGAGPGASIKRRGDAYLTVLAPASAALITLGVTVHSSSGLRGAPSGAASARASRHR